MIALATVDQVFGATQVAATPPPVLTVSQWADAHRRLPASSSARGARWRTDATPYLRGIMDAVHEPGVKKIALRKSAQVGGSEAINNIIGYFMAHDPCPMLLVQPSKDVAEEYSKERLSDLITSTPALASVVHDRRMAKGAARSESTLLLKVFPNGYLALGGAGTPNTFARRAARLAIGDDVDRFPAVIKDEGDPADLLVARTTTFDNGLVILVSTPTLKGGRIDTLFEMSDQRQYLVTCPRCRREDWITWADAAHFSVVFEDRDPLSARLACATEEHGGCGARLEESVRREMIMRGRWRPTAEPVEQGLAGFHLPAMVTTLGSASLSTWVSSFLAARAKGKESLRVFINTTLAEGWEDRGAKMNPHTLLSRREDYGEDVDVPAGAAVLTAGVDVQINRFEYQVMGWGLGEERWVVDYGIIEGDPKQTETQHRLIEALRRPYRHALGGLMVIESTCLDTGNWTEEMYNFVLAHPKRLAATKGFGRRAGNPIVQHRTHKYGRAQRSIVVWNVNTDDAKDNIMRAISMLPPDPPGAPWPGYMHFPSRVEMIHEEYFAQLCAEHREVEYNKAKVAVGWRWVLDRERNEALDTAVLCLAAKRLLKNQNMKLRLAELQAATEPAKPKPQPPAPTPNPWFGDQRRGDWFGKR